MTVRERTGRPRYIAFVVESPAPVSRTQLLRALQAAQRIRASPLALELTIYGENRGIVRVLHWHQAEAIALLQALRGAPEGFSIKTLRTSGTIRTLKERYFSTRPVEV